MGPVFTHIVGCTHGAEVRNLALSQGERVASVASQVRGYVVVSAHLITPRRAGDPSPVLRPDEVNRDRGPPSPLGRGQRPNSVPFSSGKGQKTEVGPLCPARDVGHAQPGGGGVRGGRPKEDGYRVTCLPVDRDGLLPSFWFN
jgi:hypothetical protein